MPLADRRSLGTSVRPFRSHFGANRSSASHRCLLSSSGSKICMALVDCMRITASSAMEIQVTASLVKVVA